MRQRWRAEAAKAHHAQWRRLVNGPNCPVTARPCRGPLLSYPVAPRRLEADGRREQQTAWLCLRIHSTAPPVVSVCRLGARTGGVASLFLPSCVLSGDEGRCLGHLTRNDTQAARPMHVTKTCGIGCGCPRSTRTKAAAAPWRAVRRPRRMPPSRFETDRVAPTGRARARRTRRECRGLATVR